MKGACPTCPFGLEADHAIELFQSQPSLTVSVVMPDSDVSYVVRRSIPIDIRLEMIADPTDAIKSMEIELEQNPCERDQGGNCAIADFAVHNYFNKR